MRWRFWFDELASGRVQLEQTQVDGSNGAVAGKSDPWLRSVDKIAAYHSSASREI
jgi:hypothetical protein